MLQSALIALAACGLVRASLDANLAYRSPSITVDSLAVDLARIQKRDFAQGTYQGQVNFTYGVASGDPYPNSVILWTHPVPEDESNQQPVCLNFDVSCSEDMSQPVSSGQVWTTPDVDYSAKVEAIGLEPWKKYYYQFSNCASANNTSPVGAFKTMPNQNDESFDAVSFAVYSCSNYPWGFFNAYARPSIEDSVDYVVHTGDYIYESQGDGEGDSYGNGTAISRIPQPNKEIYTLSDYRERYATYRADIDLQELHRTHAWQLIWDDHEVADNSWANGTANSNDTVAGTNENVTFTERKASAVRAYFEWMPIRQVDTNDHLRIWRKFRFGTLADLIMLDTRNYERDVTDLYYNTANIDKIRDEDDRSLMGARQEAWFHDSLIDAQQSDVDWKVVGNQVLFAHINYSTPTFQINDDSWDGYTANRERILNTIAGNGIDNLIMLAGDTHVNWVSDVVGPSSLTNGTYDPSTGQGALGVEFAGTAVSSPSSYGRNLNLTTYAASAQRLVDVNTQLQWAEGAYRGYFELHLNRQNATAMFYGFPDILTRNNNATLLATFSVDKGANKLSRPIAGGMIQGGAVKK